jgi:hypothetical protein
MNTEEVVAMIDDITDGRPSVNGWENAVTGPGFILATAPQKIVMGDARDAFNFVITDERVAREIAGALVAWANRKGNLVGENERAVSKLNSLSVVKPKFKVIHNPGEHANPKVLRSNWRAEWFRRNVGNMSQETKNRNLKDLREIQKTLSGGSLEWDDAQAAIQILRDAGAE